MSRLHRQRKGTRHAGLRPMLFSPSCTSDNVQSEFFVIAKNSWLQVEMKVSSDRRSSEKLSVERFEHWDRVEDSDI
jgi:hypothetical protein